MTPEEYVFKMGLYGLVSLLELGLGYAMMRYLQDHRKMSRFWAFFYQSLVVGFVAFNLRFLVYS